MVVSVNHIQIHRKKDLKEIKSGTESWKKFYDVIYLLIYTLLFSYFLH